MGSTVGIFVPDPSLLICCQVVAALEAIDVIAVNVGVVVQVAVTPGTAFEPEHRETSLLVSAVVLTKSGRLSASTSAGPCLTVIVNCSLLATLYGQTERFWLHGGFNPVSIVCEF